MLSCQILHRYQERQGRNASYFLSTDTHAAPLPRIMSVSSAHYRPRFGYDLTSRHPLVSFRRRESTSRVLELS